MTGMEIMAGAALAMSVVGTVAAGQQQANAQKYNAAVAEQQASFERQKAAVAAEQQAARDSRLMAAQRARMGAQGLDMTTGSPLVVLEETARQADTDYRTVLAGGEVAAGNLQSQASLSRMYASSAITSSWLNAGSTALSGASRIGEMRDNRLFREQMTNGTVLGGQSSASSYMGY